MNAKAERDLAVLEFVRRVRELDAVGECIAARRLIAANPHDYARVSEALRTAEKTVEERQARLAKLTDAQRAAVTAAVGTDEGAQAHAVAALAPTWAKADAADIQIVQRVRELHAAGQALAASRVIADNAAAYARGSAALRAAESGDEPPEAA
ncbi:MAG: hypothetical protein IPM35_20350 [Myxococcales bacterium]|nr:hypothetical protein [Myxococcales bacterium]